MEFGLGESLPIHSSGLGVLAGDYLLSPEMLHVEVYAGPLEGGGPFRSEQILYYGIGSFLLEMKIHIFTGCRQRGHGLGI